MLLRKNRLGKNVLERPAYSPDLNHFKKFWAIVKYRLQKQAVFQEKFEENVSEILNEINVDVVKHLCENYINRQLDV